MISKTEKIAYSHKIPYQWRINANITGISSAKELDEICATCDSIRGKEIERLKGENKKLKQQLDFLRGELQALELRTAPDAPAVSLQTMADELTATPEGKAAWEGAWNEREAEWRALVKGGRMSKVKYHRLRNGMDQKTLAERLGTAQPNISRIERPGYNVPTKTLKQLAAIFGMKVEDLIGD